MATRITNAHLGSLIDDLNRITESPTEYYDMETRKANVGNYHLDGAYGGVKLVRTVNDAGGIRDVLGTGYVSKRDCYNAIRCYLQGMQDNQRNMEAA